MTESKNLDRWIKIVLPVSLGILLIGAISLMTRLEDSGDLVKLRNAMLYEVRSNSPYRWTPGDEPRDFLSETKKESAELELGLQELVDISHLQSISEFDASIDLARALISNKQRPAIPIQMSTADAFDQITSQGKGYCADYTQVYSGLAHIIGIPIREWGMSFDGYGGDGHAFTEIYDRAKDKWIFVDSFYSFYVTDSDGEPMSVEEFRHSLLDSNSDQPRVHIIDPSHFSFRSHAALMEYYRKGAPSLYMIWGNNVLSYDEQLASRLLSSKSRLGEQLLSLILGKQPKIVVDEMWGNRQGLSELAYLRALVFMTVASSLLLVVAFFLVVVRRRRG